MDMIQLIYTFDPTFHTEHHLKILDDLHFFWRETHCASISMRICQYHHIKKEHQMLIILNEIIETISDELKNPAFLATDPFERYASLVDNKDRKDQWFSFIKLHSGSTHGFRHHIRILEEILNRDR
jgi:hypothetical protein